MGREVRALDVADLAFEALVDDLVLLGLRELRRVLVLVVVDEPSEGGSYYGGIVAAPYAAKILEESLRLQGVAPQTVMKPGDL